jgi:hypothetical protein
VTVRIGLVVMMVEPLKTTMRHEYVLPLDVIAAMVNE